MASSHKKYKCPELDRWRGYFSFQMLMVDNSLQSITVYETLKERLHTKHLLGTTELKFLVGTEFLSISICAVIPSLIKCLFASFP